MQYTEKIQSELEEIKNAPTNADLFNSIQLEHNKSGTRCLGLY